TRFSRDWSSAVCSSDLFYFHAGTNALTQPIVWQGQTYQPLPIMVEGFTYDGQGALPRPKLKIANVTKIVSAFLANYDDLVGAREIGRASCRESSETSVS